RRTDVDHLVPRADIHYDTPVSLGAERTSMVSPKAARRLAMIATMERIDPEMNAADPIVFSIVTVDSVDGLERMWRELEARADGSFFLSWHWIGCWLRET